MMSAASVTATRSWVGIQQCGNGDVYASVHGGDIYKLTSGALDEWVCDECHERGSGNASELFAAEEVEHCLHGCNGSLRLARLADHVFEHAESEETEVRR